MAKKKELKFEHIIDERVNQLVKSFDAWRSEQNISVTETFLLLQVLQMKVKKEIDTRATEMMFNNMDTMLDLVTDRLEGQLK